MALTRAIGLLGVKLVKLYIMYNKEIILVDLSEKECVSITGGKEGDAAEGLGWLIGAIGGIVMEVVDFLF